MPTCAGGASKVHECPGVLAGEAQHVAGLEVEVRPPAAVQLRQPLCYQAQRLHASWRMYSFLLFHAKKH